MAAITVINESGNTGTDYPVLVKQNGSGHYIQQVQTDTSGTSTVTSVAGSASAVTLLAANANRVEALITNDSTAVLYILCGSQTPTTSLWTYRLNQYDQAIINNTAEIIKGIWASATGSARVTEVSL